MMDYNNDRGKERRGAGESTRPDMSGARLEWDGAVEASIQPNKSVDHDVLEASRHTVEYVF